LRSKILAFLSWSSPSVIGLTTRGSLRDEVDQREVGPGKKSGQSLALRAPIVDVNAGLKLSSYGGIKLSIYR